MSGNVSLVSRALISLLGGLALAGSAQAGACTAYAGKQYVFLMQGFVLDAPSGTQASLSLVGRLQFDRSGSAGTFSSFRNGGVPAATLQETGSFSCGANRSLGGMAQSLQLSNGLGLLAMREGSVVQLLNNEPQMALTGEARAAADWSTLAGLACDQLLGRNYSGRSGMVADGVGQAALAQWSLQTLPGSIRDWYSTASGSAAVARELPLTACSPAAGDGAAVLSLNNGVQGWHIAYPAADGSAAWVHMLAGRGVGGWLRPR